MMIPPKRPSGLPLVGEVPWGTHLCHFYGSKADLVDAVVPFLRAGLSSSERCLWITCEPLRAQEARETLRARVPELDLYIENRQIEILDHGDWYLRSGQLEADEVIQDWIAREREALSHGFTGLRLSANTFWLERQNWRAFSDYEAKIHRTFHQRRTMTLCSYWLGTCGTDEVVDVLRNHASALIQRGGRWELIDSATSMLATSLPVAPGHDVQFYDDREVLVSRVAEFVGEGLTRNEAALLISTSPNTSAILKNLARQAIDPHHYRESGQLVTVDAHEMLPSLLVGGQPDENLFAEVVGRLVSRLRAERGQVRVYGELANLLIGEGSEPATLELERLWNQLLGQEPFRLLCSYEMDAWALRGSPGGFARVCAAHDRVTPAEGADGLATVTDTPRLLADLQHKTRALTFEARTRRDLEAERRQLREAENLARAQAEEATRHLARLQRVTSALSRALTPDAIARVVATEMAEAVGAEQALLALPAENGTKLKLLGLAGLPAAAPHPLEIATDAPLPIVAAFHGRLVCLSSPSEIAAEFPAVPEPRAAAIVCVPLALGDQPLGAIGFGYRESQEFTPARRGLLDDIARQASLALEQSLLLQQAEHERQRAEMATRAKDEFLATLSHELRTPLTSILGWARMLQVGGIDERGRQQALATIERNAKLEVQLLEDLLDVSRIAAGKLQLDLRPVDLGAVILAAADVIRPAAEAKEIRLETEVDPSAGAVLGDPDRLQQVFWNLLSNAVKFTPRRGRVVVIQRRVENGVEVRVRDTGRGIGPEFLPFVFDRFRQAEKGSTTRTQRGLGLGLAIVRHLVELHGGSVAAESPGEGHGATFTVVLPVIGPRVEAAGEPKAFDEPAASLAGLRILLVEDEADTRELLTVILERAGAAVTVVASASDALRALEQSAGTPAAYTMLVADIGLPGEDGYALVHRLRQLPPERGGGIPALALTAYATAQDRRRALTAGFHTHLTKPADPAEIIAAVARLAGAPPEAGPPASEPSGR
jgi:signal transduction histidine kinase/ActR/RegA family two-component response regulator